MNAIDYLIAFLLLAVAAVLLAGLFTMLTGKDARRSNRLMVWRVVLQGTVVLLAALFLTRS